MARVGSTLALAVVAAAAIAVAADYARAQAPAPAVAEGEATAAPQKKPSAKKADPAKSGAPAKGRDPAAAEKSLDQAQKSLDGGKPDLAINQVNSVISAGGLDARSMARALAVRGHAHKKQGKPAQAIADLQSALYLRNGLNDAERAAATQARAEAYREAGLGEPAPASQAAAAGQSPAANKETAAPARTAKQAATKAEAGAQAPAPASSPISTAAVQPPRPAQPEQPAPATSSGGIGGFFSNLFGGSSSQPQTPAAAAPARAPTETAVSSWSETGPSAPGGTKAKAPPKTAAAPAAPAEAKAAPQKTAASAKGAFRIELAAVKSREEAKRAAEKVRTEHASVIGQRSYTIVEATFGNMGTFYRAQFGPFDESVEPRALCSTLRTKGLDCQVMEN